jgi:hypothetical protein
MGAAQGSAHARYVESLLSGGKPPARADSIALHRQRNQSGKRSVCTRLPWYINADPLPS